MKKIINKNYIFIILVTLVILFFVSAFLSFPLGLNRALAVVYGSTYLLIIPGFVWSFIFIKKGEADTLTRLMISLALSIGLVPLVAYLLNKAGVPINLFSIFIETAGIAVIGLLIILFKKQRNKS